MNRTCHSDHPSRRRWLPTCHSEEPSRRRRPTLRRRNPPGTFPNPRFQTPSLITLLVLLAALLAGCTPSLHDTVARRDAETARALLAADPHLVMARNKLGKTPLHYAITYDAADTIDLLLERGADINAKDNTGLTPLHVAAMWGRANIASILIDRGANLSAKDQFGDTPLHLAALWNQTKMAEVLIKAGADPSTLNNNHLTPLDSARQNRKPEVADLLAHLAK